jgi:hypothetical protein
LLSVRDSAETWWQSIDTTILPYARLAEAPAWSQGRGLTDLFERFTGTQHWDHPATLMAAYEQHNAKVRESVRFRRLVEWRAAQGWEPICRVLNLPIPDIPFPWTNRRSEWTK